MALNERKLDTLTSALTTRERAGLFMRAWCDGEEPDDRLRRFCPPADRAEYERLCNVIETGNNRLYTALVINQEWLHGNELELQLLICLEGHQEREQKLPAAVRRGLPALPTPREVKRRTQLGWESLDDDDGPAPASWEELRERLVETLVRDLCMRWREVLAMEGLFAEAQRLLGAEVAHGHNRRLLSGLRGGLLEIQEAMAERGHAFEFPADPGDARERLQNYFDPAALRDPGGDQRTAREWMHEKQYAELEAWEREQAEMLRGGS